MTNDKKRMPWLSAFYLMWRGKAVGLGKNHRAKSLWMMSAVIFSIAGPIFQFDHSQTYSGALPPEVPMIKTTGVFVRYVGHVGLKAMPYILLNADNGMTYRTEDLVAPKGLSDLGDVKPPVKVYVEGFLLNNGSGSFYPLKLTTISGQYIVSSDGLMKQLLIGRDPFYYKKSVFLFFMIFVSWCGAIFYARQLRIWFYRVNM